jgi:protein phosphatase
MTLLAAMRYFAVSHIGLRRARNEDSYAVYDSRASRPAADHHGVLFVVADGIGGHACGDRASRMACQGLAAIFNDSPDGFEPEHYAQRLNDLIFAADLRIREQMLTDPNCGNMGTTLSALLIADHFAVAAHVGDSRIYRLREDQLVQLTTDHSFVQEMIAEGELAPDAAATHPLRGVLTRAVGTQEPLEEVDIRILDAAPGDRFMLCSDGLHDMVSADEIARALRREIDPKATAERLLDAALRNGGRDNITIIAIHLFNAASGAK